MNELGTRFAGVTCRAPRVSSAAEAFGAAVALSSSAFYGVATFHR
jgi:hypothetical protein